MECINITIGYGKGRRSGPDKNREGKGSDIPIVPKNVTSRDMLDPGPGNRLAETSLRLGPTGPVTADTLYSV
jgi:hypothetical protein